MMMIAFKRVRPMKEQPRMHACTCTYTRMRVRVLKRGRCGGGGGKEKEREKERKLCKSHNWATFVLLHETKCLREVLGRTAPSNSLTPYRLRTSCTRGTACTATNYLKSRSSRAVTSFCVDTD